MTGPEPGPRLVRSVEQPGFEQGQHHEDSQPPAGAPVADGPVDLFASPESTSLLPVPRRESLRRTDLQRGATVDGEPVPDRLFVRLQRMWQQLITSDRERQEAEVDGRLAQRRPITRTNLVAVVSPKGGVGKTTCSYLIGDALAARPKLRTLAIDTNPDYGTLGKLAADTHHSEHQLTDVIARMDRIHSASELDPFMSTTPTGLHLLASPQRPEVMAKMTPELYGDLLAFLGRFYHVILLDLGTGVTAPLAQFALQRADQVVLVTQSDWVTLSTVYEALDDILVHLGGHQVTVAFNKVECGEDEAQIDLDTLDKKLRKLDITRRVQLPMNRQLHRMLNQGTYIAEQLEYDTRVAVKRLALAVAGQLV